MEPGAIKCLRLLALGPATAMNSASARATRLVDGRKHGGSRTIISKHLHHPHILEIMRACSHRELDGRRQAKSPALGEGGLPYNVTTVSTEKPAG